MGLRNLYFARLLVLKPFWNPKTNDFDVRSVKPTDIRVSKSARKEEETEFVIERVPDNLCAVVTRFPNKKDELMKLFGFKDETDLYIRNPEMTYYEAWIGDYVIFKHDNIILDIIKNPYWDWDGMLITEEEEQQINTQYGEERRAVFTQAKLEQSSRQSAQKGDIPPAEGHTESQTFKAYNFNYFSLPRKPYIFATILNNENKPIGRTDFITLAAPLQESVDTRKQDIGTNCELVNGVIKVDSSVMPKEDAQKLAYEAKGIIWGKDVVNGVAREVGQGLPQMVFDDMIDSRNEIDNIMAASSAFRGEREGQETKAGRIALIQQSFLRLNELVQVVDYVSGQLFSWFYQLAKTRYTEYHYAKWIGEEETTELVDMIQDDFETGSEVVVIPGKTLPEDAEFRYERAQNDVAAGFISPVDYLEEAGYQNPKDLARNAVMYQQNPAEAVGLNTADLPVPFKAGMPTPEQIAAIAPNLPPEITPTPAVPKQ